MSRQTDQLLLIDIDPEDPKAEQKRKAAIEQRIAILKETARLLQDLSTHKGFEVYLEYLRSEARAAFSNMQRTEGELDLARTVGTHTALMNAISFVPDQIKEINETLLAGDGT